MGHPKLKKKTYSKPTHPWQKERLEEEKELLKEFGLKNKEEIWKVSSLLRKYAGQAKTLIALDTSRSELERAQLLKKLSSSALIEETAKLEDALTITLKDILSRRLQTLVHKNKLAKTLRQARQLITHEHITVGDKKITSPSYLVSRQEESLINFAPNSALSSPDHPERVVEQELVTKAPEEKKEAKTKEKPKKKEEKKETTEKKEEKKETTEKKEEKKETTEKKEEKKAENKKTKEEKKEETKK